MTEAFAQIARDSRDGAPVLARNRG